MPLNAAVVAVLHGGGQPVLWLAIDGVFINHHHGCGGGGGGDRLLPMARVHCGK